MDRDVTPGMQVGSPRFSVDVALTTEELDAYEAWVTARTAALVPTPGGTALWAVGFVLALLFTFVAVVLEDLRKRGAGGVIAVLMFAIYAIGMYAPTWRDRDYQRRLRLVQRASPYTRAPRRYTFDEDGLLTRSPYAALRAEWPAFQEVVVADGLLLLCMDPLHAAAVPLRAFASPEQAEHAVAFARAKVAEAKARAKEQGADGQVAAPDGQRRA